MLCPQVDLRIHQAQRLQRQGIGGEDIGRGRSLGRRGRALPGREVGQVETARDQAGGDLGPGGGQVRLERARKVAAAERHAQSGELINTLTALEARRDLIGPQRRQRRTRERAQRRQGRTLGGQSQLDPRRLGHIGNASVHGQLGLGEFHADPKGEIPAPGESAQGAEAPLQLEGRLADTPKSRDPQRVLRTLGLAGEAIQGNRQGLARLAIAVGEKPIFQNEEMDGRKCAA